MANIQLSFSFFLGPEPGHRLPWSQVLREKMAPLTVGHTHRVPYLLFASLIASSNKPGSVPITNTQPPKYPGRCAPVIYFIQLRFWGCSPRSHQVEPVPMGAKCWQPGPRKSEPTTVLQKAHQSSKRMVVLNLHILCIGVITRTGG